MAGLLFPATPGSVWAFVVLTLAVGSGAAWATGRALAKAWASWLMIPLCVVVLACVVRFLHLAVARENLFSSRSFVVELVLLVVVAGLGYRRTRARQMTTQYAFAYRAAGPFGWRPVSRCTTAAPAEF